MSSGKEQLETLQFQGTDNKQISQVPKIPSVNMLYKKHTFCTETYLLLFHSLWQYVPAELIYLTVSVIHKHDISHSQVQKNITSCADSIHKLQLARQRTAQFDSFTYCLQKRQ